MMKRSAINQGQPSVSLNGLPVANQRNYAHFIDNFNDLSHQVALLININNSLQSISDRLRGLGDNMRGYLRSENYNNCSLYSIAQVASRFDRIAVEIKDEIDSLVLHIDKQHHLTRGVREKTRLARTEARELYQYIERLEALGNDSDGSVNAKNNPDLHEPRHPRFDEIKKLVRTGRYKIDLEKTAEQIILNELIYK